MSKYKCEFGKNKTLQNLKEKGLVEKNKILSWPLKNSFPELNLKGWDIRMRNGESEYKIIGLEVIMGP